LSKDDVAGSRTVKGVRASLSIVQRRPRWLGEDTRVLKAVCSSWEALEEDQLEIPGGMRIIVPDIPDCIFRGWIIQFDLWYIS
jgi:hypothetical protein